MSKLPPSLKALIHAPHARPGPVPAPPAIRALYASIARDAASLNISLRPWLTISAAATFTLNCPDALAVLHSVAAASSSSSSNSIAAAETIREVGLKCISFNGIPRTINCLNAFRASLPAHILPSLCTQPSRAPDADTTGRGVALWKSVYAPLHDKLTEKLGLAHPDLPGVILHGHYALLLADPPPPLDVDGGSAGVRLGRGLTSLVAIACLRAQGGVAPQVVSHLFGLRKAMQDGSYAASQREFEADQDRGLEWLAGDEGSAWILTTVDRIAAALGGVTFGHKL